MRRRRTSLAVILAAVLAGALFQAPPAVAGGGGGCHEPVTDASGTTVTIRNLCYGPTVLRVPAGATVTFVNRDPMEHPTSGSGLEWSVDGTPRGRDSVRFDEPGVYPYFCHVHPGMVGVVLVGDGGTGKAAGTAKAGRVTPVAPDPQQELKAQAAPQAAGTEVAAEPAAARQATSPALGLGILVGLGLAGTALLALRRRNTRTGAEPRG